MDLNSSQQYTVGNELRKDACLAVYIVTVSEFEFIHDIHDYTFQKCMSTLHYSIVLIIELPATAHSSSGIHERDFIVIIFPDGPLIPQIGPCMTRVELLDL